MYFISKFFQYLKTVIALIGTIMATSVVIYGAVASGGSLYIIGGSLYLATSLFLLFDSSKVVHDIKKQIDILKGEISEFAQENRKLEGHVSDLEKIKGDYVTQIRKLQTNLEESTDQLCRLDKLKDQYVTTSRELQENLKLEKGQIQELSEQNQDLAEKLEKMAELKESIQMENAKYGQMVAEGQKQISQLENIQDQYVGENERLTNELQKLEVTNHQLKEQTTYLYDQVEKLKKLYADTKQLMLNLAQAGDVFNQFSDTIDTNLVKLDTTSDDLDQTALVLHNLVEKLKDQKFEDLDLNADGLISPTEFTEALDLEPTT